MSSTTTPGTLPDASWSRYLWLAQLLVPLPVIGYAARRFLIGDPPGPVLLPAALLALLWTVAAITVLSLPRGRRWIGARRLEILTCFIALGSTIALFDLALTVTGTVPTIGAIRARSLEYRASVATRHRLIPKSVERSEADPFRINRRGLRGGEVSLSPPAGRLRLLFLGGSQVFDFEHDWPGQVEDRLQEQGLDVEVINAAVPGHASGDSLGKLTTDLWLFAPDLVFTCHAWNDIKYFGTLSPELPYRDFVGPYRGDWRIRPQGFDRWLSASALYRRMRASVQRTLAGNEGRRSRLEADRFGEVGPAQYRLNLRTIIQVTRDLGALPVLCKQARLATESSPEDDRRRIAYGTAGLDHQRLVEAFAATDLIVEEAARDLGARVVDLNGPLNGRSELFRDHVHFTAAGSRTAADYAARDLEAMLAGLLTDPDETP